MAISRGPGSGLMAAQQAAIAAARKAAEEARQRAEQARRAAEAQRKAQEAAAKAAQLAQAAKAAAARAAQVRAQASTQVAKAVARTTGPRAAVKLDGAPKEEVTTSSARRYSLSQLQAVQARGPADLTAANAYFSRFKFSNEAPEGSTVATAIARTALAGGKPDTGKDGELNCVEAVVAGQTHFAEGEPRVKTEIVVAGGHAVLRMPDGTYYDPTKQGLVSRDDAAQYDGVDGITLDERAQMEAEAKRAASTADAKATAEERELLATRAVMTLAAVGALDEPSAIAQANDVGQTETQLQQDAAEIEAATREDPAEGAALLESKLEDASPEYREELIVAAEPSITLMGEAVSDADAARDAEQQMTPIIESLARSAELVSPAAQQSVGEAFVAGIPPHRQHVFAEGSRLNGVLAASIRGGRPALAFGVLEGVRASGSPNLEAVERTVRLGTQQVQNDFDQAQKKVDALNAELYANLEAYGPALTDEQKQAAVDNWMQTHAETYAAWEEAGGKLAPLMLQADRIFNDPSADPLQKGWATAVLQEQLPAVSLTQAGQTLLAEAVEREGIAADSGAETHTLLDTLEAVGGTIKDAHAKVKWLDNMASLTVRSAGAVVVGLAGANPERADRLINGLGALSRVMNVDDTVLNPVLDDLRALTQVAPGDVKGMEDALDNLNNSARKLDGGVSDGRFSQAFKGVGLTISIVSLADSWANMSDAAVHEQISTLAATVQVTAEGGLWAMDLLGKGSSLVLKRAGALAGGIQSGVQIYQGIGELRDGNYTGAAGHGLLGFGGALMTVGALTGAVPVVGWAIGGAMIVTGGILKGMSDDKEARKQRQAFLESTGVDPKLAEQLAQQSLEGANRTLDNLEAMGFTTEQVQGLSTTYPTLLNGSLPNDNLLLFSEATGLKGPALLEVLDAVAASATGEGGNTPDGRIRFLLTILERTKHQHGGLDGAAIDAAIAEYETNDRNLAEPELHLEVLRVVDAHVD
jgi:hypothetical protein